MLIIMRGKRWQALEIDDNVLDPCFWLDHDNANQLSRRLLRPTGAERSGWTMTTSVKELQSQVRDAGAELDSATAFHEAWKPAAFDTALHVRLGTSFAAQTFLVIRSALRREMLLSLARIWGSRKDELRVDHIARQLTKPLVFEELVRERAANWPFGIEAMRSELVKLRATVIAVTTGHRANGKASTALEYLRGLRNEQLAHRSLRPKLPMPSTAMDEEIEALYQKTSDLMATLYNLVLGIAYEPAEFADIHSVYAGNFWDAVRGERTEGHPRYRGGPS